MSPLEYLQHFMLPYYNTDADITLLETYLTDYVHPECAASALWNELSGRLAFANEGMLKISIGAEKFEYAAPGTLQLACQRQYNIYSERCDALNSIGSCAIKVDKATVGGVTELFGS